MSAAGENDRCVPLVEAARMLGISKRSVQRLIAAGELERVRDGICRCRLWLSSLLNYMRKGKSAGAGHA